MYGFLYFDTTGQQAGHLAYENLLQVDFGHFLWGGATY